MYKKIILISIIIIFILFCFVPKNKTSFDSKYFIKNSNFTIDDKEFSLKNGSSKIQLPNSSSEVTTRFFGNDVYGDINGDKLEDIAYLITQETGGSGTFYYAVVALKTPSGYKNTNAFFIGDRIAPQSNEIHSDSLELNINYAERNPGEPMSTQPSLGAVKILKVTKDGVLEGLMK